MAYVSNIKNRIALKLTKKVIVKFVYQNIFSILLNVKKYQIKKK